MKIKTVISLILYVFMLHAQTGLVGEYFNGTDFEKKVLTRTDAKIDFAWWHSSPQEGIVNQEYYSIRWTGKILAPETGEYVFSAKFDDGIRFWINDVPMLNAWGLHNEGDFSNKITLVANKTYTIKVEYFNAMREGEITLLWQLPSDIKAKKNAYQTVSEKYFSSKPAPTPPQKPIIASKSTTPPTNKPKPEIKNQKSPYTLAQKIRLPSRSSQSFFQDFFLEWSKMTK